MRHVFSMLMLLAAAALIGCTDNAPMNGRAEDYSRSHLVFGNYDLEQATRVDAIQATQDQYGLLHVTVPIRNTSNDDEYVDAWITFTRNGAFVEKLGPQTFTFKANLPDTIQFTSTQPADDFSLSLSNAR